MLSIAAARQAARQVRAPSAHVPSFSFPRDFLGSCVRARACTCLCVRVCVCTYVCTSVTPPYARTPLYPPCTPL